MFALCTCLVAKAQDGQNNSRNNKPNQKEKIETYKIGFITQRLDLTSKEAEAFWPVFNKYEKEIGAIRKTLRELNKNYSNKTTVTEQEANEFILENLRLKQLENETLKKYVLEFKKVIPTSKVAKLMSIEQEFKMKLLHQLKEDKK